MLRPTGGPCAGVPRSGWPLRCMPVGGVAADDAGTSLMRRDEVPTPALLVDLDALDRNIATMAASAAEHGFAVRPHAKSHKCVEIAQRLARAGAIGVCCATIGEAEAMAHGGIAGILVTAPLASPDALDRLRRLLLRGADIRVVADDPRLVVPLAAVARASGQNPAVSSSSSTSVSGAPDASRSPMSSPWLAPSTRPRPCASPASRPIGAICSRWRRSRSASRASRLRRSGSARPSRRSAWPVCRPRSSPAAAPAAIASMPRQACSPRCSRARSCSSIRATAPSRSARRAIRSNRRCLSRRAWSRRSAPDASSSMPAGRPSPRIAECRCPGAALRRNATYRYMGDEHGAVDFDGGDAPAPGTAIEFLTSHCDPTVNLYSRLHVVRGEEVVDVWPIRARY